MSIWSFRNLLANPKSAILITPPEISMLAGFKSLCTTLLAYNTCSPLAT